MRIVASADLHYGTDNAEAVRDLARRMVQAGGDVLVLAGDIAAGPLTLHREALELFSGFDGPRLLVAGNHDLWEKPGHNDTRKRYRKDLAAAAKEAGFHYLDRQHFVADGVGFIGCIGWYDYSLRQQQAPEGELAYSPAVLSKPKGPFQTDPERMGLPWEDLTEKDYALKALQWSQGSVSQGAIWNDRFYVDWGRSDAAMARQFAGALRPQASKLADSCDELVGVTHFVPFGGLLPDSDRVPVAWARAYAGSTLLGEALEEAGVHLALFGHWHHQQHRRLQGLLAVNVSSDRGRLGPVIVEKRRGRFEVV